MTKNKIITIYFLREGSTLPEGKVENIIQTATVGNKVNFSVEFWTNIETLDNATLDALTEANVKIKDYGTFEEEEPTITNIIKSFVQRGDKGDITAYAAASDILRIAIAKKLETDTLYIYYDCNDISFSADLLQEQLRGLPEKFKQNPWGLAFSYEGEDLKSDRIIITKKNNNPDFLEEFFLTYFELVKDHYFRYELCQTLDLKRKFIKKVTCFTSLFRLKMKRIIPHREIFYINEYGRIIVPHPMSVFFPRNLASDATASLENINFATYITSERSMTKNKIVTIYFLRKGSLLPEGTVENIIQTATVGSKVNFSMEFWTNTETLDQAIFNTLAQENVEIKDYRTFEEEKEPTITNIIKSFVQRGDEGDIAAYAAASDILRIAIAKKLETDTLYIYYDCNDTSFSADLLQEQLGLLPETFQQNPWGLAFGCDHNSRDLRNDCIIVTKKNNPIFLDKFFLAYFKLVKDHYPQYEACQTADLKQKFIKKVTCFTSLFLLKMEKIMFHDERRIVSCPVLVFFPSNLASDKTASLENINSATYITLKRLMSRSSTWRQFDLRLDSPELDGAQLDRNVIYINLDKKQYRFLSLWEVPLWSFKNQVIVEFPKDIDLANVASMLTDPDLKERLSADARRHDPALQERPNQDQRLISRVW